ncbi:MAG: hypothetical protein WB987_01645 [Candidatus Acidiferrales bacterium]
MPLSKEPYRWFAEGLKQWELRKYGRQYTERHVRVGRKVELRRGYSTRESLWGVITEIVLAPNLHDFFAKVDYKIVVPVATSEKEAIQIAEKILRIPSHSGTPVFAFRVDIAA